MGSKLSKAYLLTKVLTATRQEVVVYLYEGAIRYLHQAQEALEKNDRAACGQSIDKVINILIELSGSLNYTTGGHLAMRLDSIYNYLIQTLTLAAAHADSEALGSCEGILVILNDAWHQAASSAAHMPEQPALTHLQISA